MTTATLRSASVAASRPSLMELAQNAGLLQLSPSDLVFEANQPGFAYYDFVMSLSALPDYMGGGFEVYLAKLDPRTNLEWFETLKISKAHLKEHNLPSTELAIITLGVLTWREELRQARLLCLVSQLHGPSDEQTPALEALKRACGKFKCTHHVMATGERRSSMGSLETGKEQHFKVSESMKLRVLMCQTRTEHSELPAQAIREGKYLLTAGGNPFLCLCFPLS
ncbi:unnamed protein product [Bursaphelenchus xylophilus]|uniref:(pine wood nematode) hypothetical protein n=1 Tax=Bursaphelenchus xylophilus TaxID=6326 RepID=A0A1I7SS53_BURXY|nr:unnamed protein product [Bursaphelenchus xylophilus]CAG9105654.1 unnamed protein product [Bursaphelenchus xylophilus]